MRSQILNQATRTIRTSRSPPQIQTAASNQQTRFSLSRNINPQRSSTRSSPLQQQQRFISFLENANSGNTRYALRTARASLSVLVDGKIANVSPELNMLRGWDAGVEEDDGG